MAFTWGRVMSFLQSRMLIQRRIRILMFPRMTITRTRRIPDLPIFTPTVFIRTAIGTDITTGISTIAFGTESSGTAMEAMRVMTEAAGRRV